MKPDRAPPDIIVVGASAGGVDALKTLVSKLPVGLDASIFIVLHLWAETESLLPQILSRAGRLPVSHPADGELFEAGRIYTAPPDRHLIVHDGTIRVVRGPKENLHRPAIDVLFRSAAMSYGSRVIGVVLTGADDDGTAGLRTIKDRGGIAIVQDPADSAHPTMPESAMRAIGPDFTLPVSEIGPILSKIVSGVISVGRTAMSEPVDKSLGQEEGMPFDVKLLGTPTAFSCPDCNGTLWELQEGELLRYRCRVGHAYSALTMAEAQSDAVERALWEAVRVLEESASISRRIALKSDVLRQQLTVKADERERHAAVIRGLLVNGKAA